MKHFLAHSELEEAVKSADFVLSTQRQIAKDFGMSGLSFDPAFESDPLEYAALREELEDRVGQLMERGERSLLQLLYQIDIPQDDFLALTGEPDFLSRLSDLIIRREAYKVYLRQRF